MTSDASTPENSKEILAQTQELITQGLGVEALEMLVEARKEFPEYVPFLIKQAVALRALGRGIEACALLDPHLKFSPENLSIRDEYAICLRIAGQADQSLKFAEETLASHPAHRAAAVARIDALVALGRASEALKFAEEARGKDPEHLPFLLKLANSLRAIGRPQDAVLLLEPALGQFPTNQALRDELTVALRLSGDPTGALRVAEGTLEKKPQHVPAINARVDTLISLGRSDEALQVISEARQHAPHHLALAIKHAAILRGLGRGKDGAGILQPLLNEERDQLSLIDELGFCLRQSGEAERGLELAEQTLSAHPNHLPAIASRIDTLVVLGRVDEALGHIEAVHKKLPDHIPFIIRNATLLRSLGKAPDAVPLLEEALGRSPGHQGICDELSVCLRLSGDIEKGLALSLDTLQRHPLHLPAHIARIDALVMMGNAAEALAAAETALQIAPQHLPFLIKYASVLRSLGRVAEAIKLLEPKLAVAPDNPGLRDELGRCYRQVGSEERTLELIEETLHLRPGHRAAVFAKIDTLVSLRDRAAIEKLSDTLAEQLSQGSADGALTQGEIEGLAKMIPHLGPEVASRLMKSAAQQLLSAGPILQPLTLWVIYRTADQIGLGSRFLPLLSELMGRQNLPLPVCDEIIKRLFRIGYPDVEKIAEVLKAKLSAPNQFVFLLGFSELMSGAEVAVESRDRNISPRTPAQALILAQMLVRAGRTKLALRYAYFARLQWPWHLQLFVFHLDCLFLLGRTEELRTVISHTNIERLDFRVAAARTLLKVDDGSDGVKLLKAMEPGTFRYQADQDLLRYYLRRGETKEAEALYESVLANVPLRTASHYGPELDGTVMVDMNLAEREGSTADHKTMVPKAGAVIAKWMRSNSGQHLSDKTSVPLKVMQYWDKKVPPDDIADLMKTWRDAPDVAYHRFDRRGAMEWLATSLGDDWRAALRAARSPAEESDYFRLAWLMIEGGLYVDCDDRLWGDLASEIRQTRGLTVFVEQEGAIGNNIIFAPALHPAVVWAAHAAKVALLERHNDNTWVKTGPGLLTRAVAWYLSENEPPHNITLKRRYDLGSWVQIHVQLPYKRTTKYWNASGAAMGAGAELAVQADKLLSVAAS